MTEKAIDPRWQSPLAHRAVLGNPEKLGMTETPFLGLLVLRGELTEIGGLIKKSTDISLSEKVGVVSQTNIKGLGDVRALWTSPDEWLLVTPIDQQAPLADEITEALKGQHYQLVDVSDYYTCISVTGTVVRDCLAKLISFDLHPRYFTPGMAIATRLAHAGIWLWHYEEVPEEAETMRIIIRRSHADYLWCLLAEAGREWGLPKQDPIGLVSLKVS